MNTAKIVIPYGWTWNSLVGRRTLFNDSIAFSVASALAVISVSVLNLSIAIRFGANYQADAFFIAYTIPGILATALLSAVQVVLVPTFVRLMEARGAVAGERLIVGLGATGLAIWIVVALVGIVGGPAYVRLLTPGSAPETQQLAVQISRWIFVIVPLTWLAGFLQSLLNSQHRFVFPLMSESFANVLAVSILWVGGKSANIVVVGLAFVVKMAAQILVSAIGVQWRVRLSGWESDAGYWREIGATLRGLGIRFGAALARQSSVTFERFWTANLAIGVLSALSYAQMGVNVMSRIFSASVATVLLPVLSAAALKETKGRRASVEALRLSLFMTIPVAAFSMAFSYPAARLILAFSDTPMDLVRLTAYLLGIYAWRVPFMALLSVLLAPFYAAEDVKTPVIHMVLMLGLNLLLDALLFYSIGVYGFPLAAVITDALSVVRAFWLQKRLDAQPTPVAAEGLPRGIVGIVLSTGIASALAWMCWLFLQSWLGSGVVRQVIALGIALLWGGSVYFVAIGIAKLPEAAFMAVAVKTIRAKVSKR